MRSRLIVVKRERVSWQHHPRSVSGWRSCVAELPKDVTIIQVCGDVALGSGIIISSSAATFPLFPLGRRVGNASRAKERGRAGVLEFSAQRKEGGGE